MCGIIGIVGKEEVADRLVDGLRRMEYRGYDSAGVCTVHDGQLIRRRAPGKLIGLVRELARDPAPGTTGIAHTRWATHGAPTAANAHPHATAELALVHNGIIENFRQLREVLTARGRKFESDTDTEVVAHLVSELVEAGQSPEDAVKAVLPQLRGAFALAIAFRQHPDMLIGARLGSPLVVGYGDGETYLGSDALALAPRQGAGQLRAALLEAREYFIDHVELFAPLRVAQAHLAESTQHQVVFHRHGAEQLALLGHQCDAQHHAFFERQRADGLSLKLDVALRRQDAHQGVEEGRFSGAVGADHGDHAAFGRLQVDAMQHLGLAIAGAQAFDG